MASASDDLIKALRNKDGVDTSSLNPPAQEPAVGAEPEPQANAQAGGGIATQEGESRGEVLPEADFQAQQIASDITRDLAVLENLNAELDNAEANATQTEHKRIMAQTALDNATLAEKQAGRVRDALVAEHSRTTQRITRRRIMLAEAQAAQMERLS